MKSFGRITLSTLFVLSLFSGCAKQPEATKEVKIDPSLPVVSVNGHLADMNAVAFEWKRVEDPRVEGFYIYRNDPEGEAGKLHRIDTVESRLATHYTDTTVKPDKSYQYRFSAYTAQGSESRASETVNVSTLQVIDSVSFFETIGNMPRSAKLIWRPHTHIKVKGYTVERQTLDTQKWEELAYVNHRLSAEYIDTGLKDNHVYRYRLLAHTCDGITSKPSNEVKVVTKPLPAPVKNIVTSNSLPRQISISWEPNREKDIAHYNIYRSTSSNGGFDYHVKLTATHFTDKIEEDGATYFYKITAVDTDGLESEMGNIPVQGSTLIKPNTPVISEAKIVNKAAVLHWKSTDARTVSYILVKTTKKSWLDKSIQEITGIKDTQFTDMNIEPDTIYFYQLIAVDANGLRSEPTTEAELTFTSEK